VHNKWGKRCSRLLICLAAFKRQTQRKDDDDDDDEEEEGRRRRKEMEVENMSMPYHTKGLLYSIQAV